MSSDQVKTAEQVGEAALWLDYEADSLDVNTTNTLEVAAHLVHLDENGKQVSVWREEFVVRVDEEVINSLHGVVETMHRESGLTDKLREVLLQGGPTIEEIDTVISHQMKKIAPYCKISLAGSGVCEYDRQIMKRVMPKTDALLYYRSQDLGVFRRMFDRYYPDVIPYGTYPFGEPAHRAMADVEQSMAQDEWFRTQVAAITPDHLVKLRNAVEKVLTPAPGDDSLGGHAEAAVHVIDLYAKEWFGQS